MSRPKANINWKKVDALLRAHCSGAAIAGMLGIYPDTLYKACQEVHKTGFTAYSEQKRAEGKELLRYAQFQAALNHNTTMMIWLGKQLLGQKDKQEVTSTGMQNITITVDSPETARVLKEFIDGGETDQCDP